MLELYRMFFIYLFLPFKNINYYILT